MDLARLMSKLNAIGGMQGAVTEAEEEKCTDCGKAHEGDCAVEEAKKPDFIDADDDGNKTEPMSDALKDKEEVKETDSLSAMRKLAGITECGEEYADMSPMSVTGTEAPGMGVPAQVMGMDTSTSDAGLKAKYTLSIQNGENNLQMTTDMPDEIIHIMKLAGVNKDAEVTKTAAPQEEQAKAPKQEVEEEWGNTPAQTKERDPKAYGDIRDWGMKGTGAGKPGSAMNKPSGQGDNPLGEQAMMEAYKKFKAGK